MKIQEKSTGLAMDGAGIEARLALKRCRPLEDPAVAWLRVCAIGLLISGIFSSVAMFRKLSADGGRSEWEPWAISLVIMLLSWLMQRPFWKLATQRKMLFLRSFSTDRALQGKDPAREMIRHALPSGLALGGIRPPGFRYHWLMRILFGNALTTFRYLGSSLFELEADDRNWYARLLASIAQARALVVDMRVMTPFVHDEIRLAALVAAQENRVFLLVDESRSDEEWLRIFLQAAGSSEKGKIYPRFLRIDQKAMDTSLADMIGELRDIPADPIRVDEKCHAEARSKVAEGDWNTAWWQTSVFQSAISQALIWPPIMIATRGVDWQSWGLVFLMLLVALLTISAYLKCVSRIFRTAARRSIAGLKTKPGPGALIVSALAFVSIIGLHFYPAFSAAKQSYDKGNRVYALAQVHSLEFAVQQYIIEYGQLPVEDRLVRTDGEAGIRLLCELMGENTINGGHNRIGIRFFEPRPYESYSGGLVRDDAGQIKALLDSWDKPYTVFLDADYEDRVNFNYGAMHKVVPDRKVIVASAGPDQVEGTADDITNF